MNRKYESEAREEAGQNAPASDAIRLTELNQMNAYVNPQYGSAIVVMESGKEVPVSKIFAANPQPYEIKGVKPSPGAVTCCIVTPRWFWNGTEYKLSSVVFGASDTFLCRCDNSSPKLFGQE